MMMPMRVAAGGVPAGQMALALRPDAATAVARSRSAPGSTAGGITRTGARLKLREALRGGGAAGA